MADIFAAESPHALFSPGSPYGNSTKLTYPVETNAAGVLIGNTSNNIAVANGSVIILGELLKGTLVGLGCRAVVSDAFTAATTITVGFRYVDGVDVAAPFAEDADYFLAAGSTAAAGVLVGAKTVRPVTLPKDVYLIAVVGGAAHASAGRMDISIDVEIRGSKNG